MVRASSPAAPASRRTLRNPGPATSAAAMPGWVRSRSASSSASARGVVPAFLASCMATLVAQSPCSRCRGRSTLTSPIASAGSWRLPSAAAASRVERMRAASSVGVTRASVPAPGPGPAPLTGPRRRAASDRQAGEEGVDVVGAAGDLEHVPVVGGPDVHPAVLVERERPVGPHPVRVGVAGARVRAVDLVDELGGGGGGCLVGRPARGEHLALVGAADVGAARRLERALDLLVRGEAVLRQREGEVPDGDGLVEVLEQLGGRGGLRRRLGGGGLVRGLGLGGGLLLRGRARLRGAGLRRGLRAGVGGRVLLL